MKRLWLCCLVLGVIAGSSEGKSDVFSVQGSWILEDGPMQVLDVRWLGEERILLAAFHDGTVVIDLSQPDKTRVAETVLRGGNGAVLRSHSRLARSGDLVAAGLPVYQIVTVDLSSDERVPEPGPFFEFIDDFDLHQDRLAVLGSRRNDDDLPGPVIAWMIDLEEGGEERPLLHSVDSRKGPWPIDSCGSFELGAVRFLPSGELVIVPGVEPDIYLFDAQGKLKRTWPTGRLGLVESCDLDRKRIEYLARDQEARWRWINQRRTVDDIVPLPDGDIGLIVRDALAGPGVRWTLVRLGRDGRTTLSALPFRSETDRAFLRADVEDGRAVVLIGQWWSKDSEVDVPPRIWVGRFGKRLR